MRYARTEAWGIFRSGPISGDESMLPSGWMAYFLNELINDYFDKVGEFTECLVFQSQVFQYVRISSKRSSLK